MSEKVPEWSENFSKWPDLKNPALFSSMKSMLSVEPVLEKEILRYKELCLKLLISLTVLTPEVM
jgi:hypothetical protein